MYTHNESWGNSRQTPKAYHTQQSIVNVTFRYWVKKYHRDYSGYKASEITPGYIPVNIQPDPGIDRGCFPIQQMFLLPNQFDLIWFFTNTEECNQSAESHNSKFIENITNFKL